MFYVLIAAGSIHLPVSGAAQYSTGSWNKTSSPWILLILLILLLFVMMSSSRRKRQMLCGSPIRDSWIDIYKRGFWVPFLSLDFASLRIEILCCLPSFGFLRCPMISPSCFFSTLFLFIPLFISLYHHRLLQILIPYLYYSFKPFFTCSCGWYYYHHHHLKSLNWSLKICSLNEGRPFYLLPLQSFKV